MLSLQFILGRERERRIYIYIYIFYYIFIFIIYIDACIYIYAFILYIYIYIYIYIYMRVCFMCVCMYMTYMSSMLQLFHSVADKWLLLRTWTCPNDECENWVPMPTLFRSAFGWKMDEQTVNTKTHWFYVQKQGVKHQTQVSPVFVAVICHLSVVNFPF